MFEREIRTEIEIQAAADKVWEVFADFERFPAWNPLIRTVRGDLEVGRRLVVEVRRPGPSVVTLEPRVVALVPGHELRWRSQGALAALYATQRAFRLHPLDREWTRFLQSVHYQGLLVPFYFRGDREARTREGFEAMNRALKNRVEGQEWQGVGKAPTIPGADDHR